MSNSIGKNRAMVPFTLSKEDKRELSRLAFLSDKSTADYVRQLVLPAVRSGLVFLNKNGKRVGCLLLLLSLVASFFWGAVVPRRVGLRVPARMVRRARDRGDGLEFEGVV